MAEWREREVESERRRADCRVLSAEEMKLNGALSSAFALVGVSGPLDSGGEVGAGAALVGDGEGMKHPRL